MTKIPVSLQIVLNLSQNMWIIQKLKIHTTDFIRMINNIHCVYTLRNNNKDDDINKVIIDMIIGNNIINSNAEGLYNESISKTYYTNTQKLLQIQIK